jgi:hypothetical protein
MHHRSNDQQTSEQPDNAMQLNHEQLLYVFVRRMKRLGKLDDRVAWQLSGQNPLVIARRGTSRGNLCARYKIAAVALPASGRPLPRNDKSSRCFMDSNQTGTH